MSDQRNTGFVTHYEYDPVNGPGQFVTRRYNQRGNPFVVFCTNLECIHFIEDLKAIPHWSEDCLEMSGTRFLRCPVCKEKVVRPKD